MMPVVILHRTACNLLVAHIYMENRILIKCNGKAVVSIFISVGKK